MKTMNKLLPAALLPLLFAGCSSVPQPVMPTGSNRQPVNTDARIEDYKVKTAEDVADYRERTVLAREVKSLTQDINTLKTYIVMKEMADASNKPLQQTATTEGAKPAASKKAAKAPKGNGAKANVDASQKSSPAVPPSSASAPDKVISASTPATPSASAQTGQQIGSADTNAAGPAAGTTQPPALGEPQAKAQPVAGVAAGADQQALATPSAEPELDAQAKLVRMCAALDAQVEAQTKSGKPSAFTLVRGLSIQQQIERWASSVGWNVDWNVGDSWIVPGDKPYGDDFAKAAQCAVFQLSQNGADVLADVWTGNRLVNVHQQSGVAE